MADIEDRYSTNETLLQSYRSIFISSQSFLLAVGAIVSGKNPVVLYITTILSLIMIWVLWFPVVRARHKIVDYHKFLARLSDADLGLLCSEDKYVHDRTLRAKANELFAKANNLPKITNWRETRMKIDFWIPICFSVIWIVLLVNELVTTRLCAA